MKKKIVKIITAFMMMAVGAVGLAMPTFAANDPFCDKLPAGIDPATVGCSAAAEDGLPKAVINIVNFVVGVGGLVAVVYIVIGGITYMTSNGDANKIAKAKTTILYALIGLVIAALAFAIVNFALGALKNNTGGSGDTTVETSSSADGGGE